MTDQRSWRPLYMTGAIAALLAVFVFRRNLGAELTLLGLPAVPKALPADAAGWFDLLRQHPLIGLTLYGIFDLVEYTLIGLVFLALCVALWQVNRSAVLVATVTGLTGIVVYLAANPAFAMLALSAQYAAAKTGDRQAAILAAGEALLGQYNPGALLQGTGVYITLLFVPLAGLLLSSVMLRSKVFNKATGVLGLLANGIVLAYFVALTIAPALLALPFVLSALFRVAWYFLIALRLFKLPGEPQ